MLQQRSVNRGVNDLISIEWINTVNTIKQANVWSYWLKLCLSIFLLIKEWQYLSGYFVAF